MSTRFLCAKPAPAFRFFVGLTILAFAFVAIVPRPLLAQEAATSTEEFVNDEFVNDEGLTLNDDASATATTTDELINDEDEFVNDELVNDERLEIDDNASAGATTTDEMATTTIEIATGAIETATSTMEFATTTTETATSTIETATTTEAMATSTEEIIAPQIEVAFNNVHYGEVREGAVAFASITGAAIRNTGAAAARITLWQDDMGLGYADDGSARILYGARVAGAADWLIYAPFEIAVLPDILAPGDVIEMEFLVKVVNFPTVEDGQPSDYQGEMIIDALPVEDEPLPDELLQNLEMKYEVENESGIMNQES